MSKLQKLLSKVSDIISNG